MLVRPHADDQTRSFESYPCYLSAVQPNTKCQLSCVGTQTDFKFTGYVTNLRVTVPREAGHGNSMFFVGSWKACASYVAVCRGYVRLDGIPSIFITVFLRTANRLDFIDTSLFRYFVKGPVKRF